MSILLSSIVLIPIIGSLLILISPDSEIEQGKYHKSLNIKQIALITSLINFFISLFIWYQFDSNTIQYQFVSEFNQLSFCHLNFGVDGISLYFVLLTTFVTPIALLSNYNNINNNLKIFLVSFLLLESLQICAFLSLDLLLFYIFFESVLPILFIVIIIFGHGNDRFRSAFLLFLYTLAGSLPILLCLGFFLAFAVKTPLYPFIIWLPKAHADSPLAGSIILAATILKLATYGYLRVLINFLPHGFVSPGLFICVGGIIYDRTGTRIINYIRGLVTYMPVFTILFFIFTIANTGIPLSLNFLGEQLSLIGIWQNNPIIAALGATGIILSACYSLFLYNRLSYGNLSPLLTPIKDLNRREYYLLISLIIPTILFGILPNILLDSLHTSVSALLFC